MIKHSYSVDIIIPLRTREDYDIFDRLELRAKYNLPNNFHFIIVDDGSSDSDSKKIEEICTRLGFKYLFINSNAQMFNLSRARNHAIKSSSADYLIFEDVDLVSHIDFYQWINQQIQSLLIERNWVFFNIPVSYLTEYSSQSINAPIDSKLYDSFVSEIFNANDSEIIEYHAPASSYLVCSRLDMIIHGGYDESFEGWGFEDSDLALKLLKTSKLEKPRDFYRLDTRPYQDQVQWRGWRSLYRLYADIIAFKGIYSFHKWHPIAEHRNPAVRQKNHKIYQENSKNYSKKNDAFIPLWNENEPSTLFLSKNPHSFNPKVFQVFTNPILIEEKDISINSIEQIVHKYNIQNVIFMNPYASTKRTLIYQTFKDMGKNCYVVERGALPQSIYFDINGFCAESDSYHEKNWPTHLSTEDYQKTIEYIQELKISGASLEPQGDLIGGVNLKRRLFGDSQNVKILFITLQSPSDTTTNFFCDQIGSYQNFINEIHKVTVLLENTDWRIVYKNHPLTIDKAQFDNAINVDEYHIGDILDAADAITLINSGVGVLAAAYEKPVYHFGKAFYANPDLNKAVSNAEELVEQLQANLLEVNKDKSIRFISYLINNFYSFASWKRAERKHTEQAKMSISLDIDYEILRVQNVQEIYYKNDAPLALLSSILFDRYRLDEYIERKNQVAPKPPAAAPKPKPTPSQNLNDVDKKTYVTKNPIKRKLNKLLTNPKLFFRDFFDKRTK